MKEKFDVLWNYDMTLAEKDVIQHFIEKKKLERCKINKTMAVKYNQLLDFIHKRFMGNRNARGKIESTQKPSEIERKFMDFLRIVIEGGWVVQAPEEWAEVLEFLKIREGMRDNEQCQQFFQRVAALFGFEEVLQEVKIKEYR